VCDVHLAGIAASWRLREVNDATVSTCDVDVDNGVIHSIDTVLIPA
jgi:uncharacterized surface protein with fasciclin (FAS1) repeats